jgi:hypothetical protein
MDLAQIYCIINKNKCTHTLNTKNNITIKVLIVSTNEIVCYSLLRLPLGTWLCEGGGHGSEAAVSGKLV